MHMPISLVRFKFQLLQQPVFFLYFENVFIWSISCIQDHDSATSKIIFACDFEQVNFGPIYAGFSKSFVQTLIPFN